MNVSAANFKAAEAYPQLLSPYRLGGLELKNHMVLAPMTRSGRSTATCRTRSPKPITSSAQARA